MSQAHKGSHLLLKNVVVGVDNYTSFLAHYDITEYDVLRGITPLSGNYVLFPYEGKFGGGISLEAATTNLLAGGITSVGVTSGNNYTFSVYSTPSSNSSTIEGFMFNSSTNSFSGTKTGVTVANAKLIQQRSGVDFSQILSANAAGTTVENTAVSGSTIVLDRGTNLSQSYGAGTWDGTMNDLTGSGPLALQKEGLDLTIVQTDLNSGFGSGTLTDAVVSTDRVTLAKQGTNVSKIADLQADWQAGSLVGMDATSTPNSIKLSSATRSGWQSTLGAWGYRKPISLQNITAYSKNGEPVRLTISSSSIKAGGADIRVVDNSGNIISHRIVSANDATKNYTIQFETRTIPANSVVTYYVYYGNANATSTSVTNMETNYEPITTFSSSGGAVHSHYSIWRNNNYYETYNANGVTLIGSSDDSAYNTVANFLFPYWNGTSLVTINTLIGSTNGRMHMTSNGASATALPYNDTVNNYYFVGLINLDQVGAVYAGAVPAQGNQTAGWKVSHNAHDYNDTTYRPASTVVFPSGRIQISITLGRSYTNGSSGGGVGLKLGNANWLTWNYNHGDCYVAILEPVIQSQGAEESSIAYTTSGAWISPVWDVSATVLPISSLYSVTTTSLPAGTSITLDVKTSPNNITWTDWIRASANNVPYDKYIQVRLNVTGDGTSTPVIDKLMVSYTAGYYASGTFLSAPIDLSTVVKSNGVATTLWGGSLPTGTSIVVEYSIALDGANYGAWKPIVGTTSITEIAKGTNLTIAKIKYRVTLNANSDRTSTPTFSDITFNVGTAYKTTGTWVSAPLSLNAVKWIAESSVSFSGSTPASTAVIVETSVDGGATWQTATSGNAISNIPANGSGNTVSVRVSLSTTDIAITPIMANLTLTVAARYAPIGSVVFAPMDISSVQWAYNSTITWVNNVPSGTAVTVSGQLSTDGGSTYGEWQVLTSGLPFLGIVNRFDATNARVKFKVDLTPSTDGSVTPSLSTVSTSIYSGYIPTGSYQTDPITVTVKGDTVSLVALANPVVSNSTATQPSAMFYYSKNNEEWVQVASGSEIPLAVGDTIKLKVDVDAGSHINNYMSVDYIRIDTKLVGAYPNRKTMTFKPYPQTSPLKFVKNGTFNWQLESGTLSTGYSDSTRPEGKISYPTDGVLSTQAGTISLWFKPSGSSSDGTLFYVNSNVYQMTYESGGVKMNDTTVSTEITPNGWYNVVYRWDVSASDKQYLFLFDENGDIIGADSSSLTPPALTNYTQFFVGSNGILAGNVMIDELRIDLIARTDEEIESWAYCGNPFYPRGVFGAAY